MHQIGYNEIILREAKLNWTNAQPFHYCFAKIVCRIQNIQTPHKVYT